MERGLESQLENFVGEHFSSGEVIHWQDFIAAVRESSLPEAVKRAAEEIPSGEYSKQQLLHVIQGSEVYLHPGPGR